MRRPIDSLFGRLALLVVVVLLLSHFAGYLLFRLERSQFQNRYAVEEATFLVDAVRQHVAHSPDQPLPSRVRLVDPSSQDVPAQGTDENTPLNHFLDDVRDRMPPGTQVRLGDPGKPPVLWVRQPTDRSWIVVPVQPLRPPRSVDRMVLWLTIIFTFAVMAALFAAWQLQQPLRSLANAVARFGRGQPVPPVPERGPRELRQLTHGFNQMVQEVARTENDRAVMLAGVAHDLKTPLARLRLRAEMMDEAKVRDGVVRDVDSMTHIVEQFLVFAHDGADRSETVEVDAQCERVVRSYRAVASGGAVPVLTDLKAGSGFLLPAATLDRILSNLLDNAQAYGAPPIVVATARTQAGYTLSVQDNGAGIAAQDLVNASRPFVRLDPARGGNGHSGLGLAIVERLVRRAGGEWEIGNHEGRGLRILMTFPLQAVPRTASVSESAW
ncbi:ATP-binding protein [Paraburkholderia sp. DHOC27]|uniref:ATP-binding protein n=1 Tax=Paraburkholderia sp. DHOC27 TaxID=2303330 RepID=UPI000E3C3E2F|nr:ATP-binding protein [Paraburkholderia sp. DHOC27]RFU46136.1 HAMP domain-containing protein [Paraburkholderia sp. DHOC27]